MFFDFGRIEGLPSIYPSKLTPVTVDVVEAGIITAFVILISSFIFLFLNKPSISLKNGEQISLQNIGRAILVIVNLTIGVILLVCNFGQSWEVAEIKSRTPYKAGSAEDIFADIGLRIGLRGINVTLKSDGHWLGEEKIDYNERFHWTWDQGRFGFGPYAGQLQREFRAGQYRGLPTPILWIVDYFIIDGEGHRHGRFYRTAGWYTHIAMWTAFATWIMANILFRNVIEYGAYMLGLTGILQLLGNLLWLVVRNPIPLVIPFEDATLTTHFGSSYWWTFANGIICILLASIILIFDATVHIKLYNLFDINPLSTYEEVYFTPEEILQLRKKDKKIDDIPLMPEGSRRGQEETDTVFSMRRKTILFQGKPPIPTAPKPKHLQSAV